MKKFEGEMRSDYKRSDFAKLERGKFFKEVVKGTLALTTKAVPTGGTKSAETRLTYLCYKFHSEK
jgi:hypothetical protein